jgi:hypothetical protein
MTPIRATENAQFASELNHLTQFSQFISEIATAIVAADSDFESVWNIANRVYDRHTSNNVRFMPRPGLSSSRSTALSA